MRLFYYPHFTDDETEEKGTSISPSCYTPDTSYASSYSLWPHPKSQRSEVASSSHVRAEEPSPGLNPGPWGHPPAAIACPTLPPNTPRHTPAWPAPMVTRGNCLRPGQTHYSALPRARALPQDQRVRPPVPPVTPGDKLLQPLQPTSPHRGP